jgi:hypothetical protein
MTHWNETHYGRAEEFLRLIAEAVPPAVPGQAAVAPTPPAPRPPPAATTPAAAATPAAPTAASVFKKIPWKK